MPLDATPSSPTANAYLTVSEADSYLTEERLYITAWTSASDADKERALIWATLLIDRAFSFYGTVTISTQALAWPRYGVIDDKGTWLTSTSVPVLVKKATAVYALYLLVKDPSTLPSIAALGMSRIKVDVIDISVNSDLVQEVIPASVILLLDTLGELRSGAVLGMDGAIVKVERV